MKKRVLAFIIYNSSFLTCAAQEVNIDSLKTVWNDQTQADTTRLKAMGIIAWDGYLFSQPDSAFYFAQMQYDLAEKNGMKKEMGYALNIQGISFYERGDYSRALDYYQRSLKIEEEIGDKNGIANVLNNMGVIYADQGDYPKALDNYQRSLKIGNEAGEKKGIANTLNNMGKLYKDQGDYPQALDHYQKSLKIREEIGDKYGIANALNNIGVIYADQSDHSKALDYYQRSLKIEEEIGNKYGIANALNNMGVIYADQGNYSKALDHYQRSLKIEEEIGDKNGIANTLNNMGKLYADQGDYLKALDHYQRSIKIEEEMGDKNGIAASLNNIGGLYQDQGDYQKSINECSKGLLLAQEIGAVLLQRDACQCIYDAYKSIGNGNKALEYHEKMLVLDDSLNSEETNKQLQQMEFAKQVLADSLATAEETRLVAEAHQEEMRAEEKTRNLALGGGLVLLILAGGLYGRVRHIRKSKAVLQVEKDRSENLLLNILPADIAAELKEKGRADARDFDLVSILFTDFKGFTAASEKLSAQELVAEINTCFEAFDGIMGKYNIEKIKTIGDAYMAAGGLPIPADDSVKNTALAALEMQAFISERKVEMDAKGLPAFEMRVGIHTGPVVAGIVGVKKFAYDIWGDTVNTASRMESSGGVGEVNISQATYELLKSDPDFAFESRGKIEAKGKGEMEMYFVERI